MPNLGQPGCNSQLGSASFTPRRNPGGTAGLASHLLAIKSLRAWESISSELSSAANPGDELANESHSRLPTGLGAGSPEELFAFPFSPWMSVAVWSLGVFSGASCQVGSTCCVLESARLPGVQGWSLAPLLAWHGTAPSHSRVLCAWGHGGVRGLDLVLTIVGLCRRRAAGQ